MSLISQKQQAEGRAEGAAKSETTIEDEINAFPLGDPKERFGDLKTMEIIGEGSSCTVFKVRDKSNEVWALKRVDFMKNKLVFNEVRIMKLLRHDNIVDYKDSFRQGPNIYIVMEYLANGSLLSLYTHLKRRDQYLSEHEIAYFIRGIVEGLKYMHSLDIVHMNIKSANVLIGRNGVVKIIDFGFGVKLVSRKAKCENFVVGTLRWLAPEVVRKVSYNSKADIWPLAMTLVELIQAAFPYAELKDSEEVKRALMAGNLPQIERLELFGESTRKFLRKATRVKITGFCGYGVRPDVKSLAKQPFLKLANDDVWLKTLQPKTIAAVNAGNPDRPAEPDSV